MLQPNVLFKTFYLPICSLPCSFCQEHIQQHEKHFCCFIKFNSLEQGSVNNIFDGSFHNTWKLCSRSIIHEHVNNGSGDIFLSLNKSIHFWMSSQSASSSFSFSSSSSILDSLLSSSSLLLLLFLLLFSFSKDLFLHHQMCFLEVMFWSFICCGVYLSLLCLFPSSYHFVDGAMAHVYGWSSEWIYFDDMFGLLHFCTCVTLHFLRNWMYVEYL